ncbi:MAG: twin-arginine translocation pathway signal protein [Rhodospirillales bacterium 20-64-7]|nr:MAG: twin-arginine translocation pathway signal protein [Rhodospirillales bacterium 20-64-7]HQT77352.1 YSC84-related protein [Rhodopila sp.]
MGTTRRAVVLGTATVGAGWLFGHARQAEAEASARQINSDAGRALTALYEVEPKARELGRRAKAVLIFPKIYKGGLLIGGLTGDGVLRVAGKASGYYNISAASFGLQAGGQTYSFALFFMTDAALNYLRSSDGWSIGSGPSVVVMDRGAAASMTSTTLTQDVYAVPFGQKGLMAGLGVEGSKITRIHPAS